MCTARVRAYCATLKTSADAVQFEPETIEYVIEPSATDKTDWVL